MKQPFFHGLILLTVLLLSGCATNSVPSLPTASVPPATPSLSPAVELAATAAGSPYPAAAVTPQAPTLATGPSPAAIPNRPPAITGRLDLLGLPGAGRAPSALAVLGDTLFSANQETSNLALIRGGAVQSFIPISGWPNLLAADQAQKRLYVGTYMSQTVALVEGGSVVRTQSLGAPVMSFALAPGRLYVGLGSSPVIRVLDSATLQPGASARLSVGYDVLALAADPARNRLYAGLYNKVVTLTLDTLQEIRLLDTPGFLGSLAVNPRDGTVWAGTFDSQSSSGGLVAFNADGEQVRRVPVADDLRQSVIDHTGRLFVASEVKNRVYVIDLAAGQVVAFIQVDMQPRALALDASGTTLYAANRGSYSISTIDTKSLKVSGTIPTAPLVTAMAVNEGLGRVYVANASTDSVLILENDRLIGQIPGGRHPLDLATDPATDRLFVLSMADDSLTVIDETRLSVEATLPFTRSLSTVDLDPINRRLFVGDQVLDLDSLQTEGTVHARGYMPGQWLSPYALRVDPPRRQIYAVASNGVPGSNSRLVLYSLPEDSPDESRALPTGNAGNITALALDPNSGSVYAGSSHPLAFRNAVIAWDTAGNKLAEISNPSRAAGMIVNPRTSHLFVAHAESYVPYGLPPPQTDNTVEILDTRTFGGVARLQVPGKPGPMARLGSTVYVAGKEDGWVTLIADGIAPPPPAPTLTPTPTAAPIITPLSVATSSSVSGTAAPLTATPCPPLADPLFSGKYQAFGAELGCPSGVAEPGSFAFQPFQGGVMFDDLRNMTAKRIYVLYDDHTYRSYSDGWTDSANADSCPAISPPPGLLKPLRGFGLVWCTEPDVRAQLPGAQSAEQGLVLHVQQFVRGVAWGSAEKGVWALIEDGTWR